MSYKRETLVELITETRLWNAQGCNSYTIYNQGNTNVTINGAFILEPKMSFSSPEENPDVADWSDINIQFDKVNTPKFVSPQAGVLAALIEYNPDTDPPPDKDNRIVIFKSFLKKA